MAELMALLRMLWQSLCRIGSMLAVPFVGLLAALTVVFTIVLVVCAQVEVYRDRKRAGQ